MSAVQPVAAFGPLACRYCGQAVSSGAKRCNACKAFTQGNDCWSCGAPVRPSARCGVCNSAQGKIRRWLPDSQITLALLVSLITVLGATVPRIVQAWNYGSDTRVRLIGTEKVQEEENGIEVETTAIRVAASNSGKGYAAVVRKASITFDEAYQLEPADLDVANPEETLVLAEKTSIVKLVLSGGLKASADSAMTSADRLALLRDKNATITVWVEETRPFHKPSLEPRFDSVAGGQLHDFIVEHAP